MAGLTEDNIQDIQGVVSFTSQDIQIVNFRKPAIFTGGEYIAVMLYIQKLR